MKPKGKKIIITLENNNNKKMCFNVIAATNDE